MRNIRLEQSNILLRLAFEEGRLCICSELKTRKLCRFPGSIKFDMIRKQNMLQNMRRNSAWEYIVPRIAAEYEYSGTIISEFVSKIVNETGGRKKAPSGPLIGGATIHAL